MTVRECARAQGFPDYYDFISVNESPKKVLEDVGFYYSNRSMMPGADAVVATSSDWKCGARSTRIYVREVARSGIAKDVGGKRA